jgi:membrane fusion protein (multidrug efflux system)
MDNITSDSSTVILPGSRPAPRRVRRLVLLIVVPLAVAVISAVVYLKGGRYVATDDAYLKADIVPVSVEVSGTVQNVLVKENQVVKAGQILFRLDPTPFRVEEARAAARLGQVRTNLEALKASYREKQSEIAVARSNHDYAVREQRRVSDLAQRSFVSASKLDEVKHKAKVTAQEIVTLQLDLKRIAQALGGGIDIPIEKHPDYQAALADLDQARFDLQHAQVCASLPGSVSKIPEPGQYIKAGNTAMVLVANRHLWVEANINETDLTYIHPGQQVKLQIDTYPNRKILGVVDSLSPATGAEFAVIPAQNAIGNWVKIVQRVPVRIRLEDEAKLPALRAGLSSSVEIDTGHHRHLLGLSL